MKIKSLPPLLLARPTRAASLPQRLRFSQVLAGALLLAVAPMLQAANPTTGTITPTTSIPVTWVGTATGVPPAANGETTPGTAEGMGLDVFRLTVTGTPADFAGKSIPISITWTNPGNDYDLVLRKDDGDGVYERTGDDAIVGMSGNGAPETRENVTINPSSLNSSGTTLFYVVAVYFAAPASAADQFRGTASVISTATGRTPVYQTGTATFSPNTTVRAPVAARDGEPSSRIDKLGNYYVGGIRGVPAGVDLWYFDLRPTLPGGAANPTYDPLMRNPLYRGQPDAFTAAEGAAADGGGDIDLAVGFNPDGTPILAFSSLVAANISTGTSTDLGRTFQLNPAGNATGGPPGDDRQWHEFFGANTCYLLYRTLAPAVAQVQRSIDGGFSYGPTTAIGTIGQVGCLDVDQFDGVVYASGSNGVVAVGIPPVVPVGGVALAPLTYTIVQAAPTTSAVANIFFVVKVADDNRNAAGQIVGPGTVYICYSDGTDVFLAHSTSRRDAAPAARDTTPVVFSAPVKVNFGPLARTNLLPWMETGPTPGSVGVVWFGSDAAANTNASNWRVFFSQSFNASDANPTFSQVVAGDHVIHGSNISTGGLDATGMGANRNLIDYFQIVFDPTGAAVIGYTDDHNDFDGHTYVTRQVSGPSINAELANAAATVPTPVEGSGLAGVIAQNIAGTLPGTQAPLLQVPGPNGEQVMDFSLDAEAGINTTVNQPSAVDIQSIKYTSQDTRTGRLVTATMKLSNLSAVTAGTFWRMNFAANALDSSNNLSGYANAVSDRGDQFYMRVDYGAGGAITSSFGMATRGGNGALTYTPFPGTRGLLTRASVDFATSTVTASISLRKINAELATLGRPAINTTTNNVIGGLRGQATANDQDDRTRGGSLFFIGGE